MTLKNFLLDILLFVAVLIAFEPRLSGIPIHEWLSLALGITLLVHLLWHWDWIINVGKRYFKRLFHLSRLKFFVDLLFLIAFVTVMVSGLLISRSILPLSGRLPPRADATATTRSRSGGCFIRSQPI